MASSASFTYSAPAIRAPGSRCCRCCANTAELSALLAANLPVGNSLRLRASAMACASQRHAQLRFGSFVLFSDTLFADSATTSAASSRCCLVASTLAIQGSLFGHRFLLGPHRQKLFFKTGPAWPVRFCKRLTLCGLRQHSRPARGAACCASNCAELFARSAANLACSATSLRLRAQPWPKFHIEYVAALLRQLCILGDTRCS